MLPMTREWVAKAESDYDGACEALRSRKKSRLDRICFFSQQCVEKYLKARLTEAGIPFPRTHSLPALLQLVLAVEPLWSALSPALNNLNVYGVNFRYPGTNASKADARQALKDCRAVRKEARLSLGLPV